MTAQDAEQERRDPPRWLLIGVGVLAAAALAFGIGRFTAFGNSAAPAAPSTTSADAGFARDMQVHHAQAVDMAMTIYRSTDDPALRALSYDIATGQSAQAGRLYALLVEWGLSQSGGPLMSWMSADGDHRGHGGGSDAEPATEAELRAEMGMATDAELSALQAAAEPRGSAEADCLFLSLMIRHHEGAIDMVDAVLELGTSSVTGLAASMKQTQSSEVAAMEDLQSRLACTD